VVGWSGGVAGRTGAAARSANWNMTPLYRIDDAGQQERLEFAGVAL
jgi:hypothetical protein